MHEQEMKQRLALNKARLGERFVKQRLQDILVLQPHSFGPPFRLSVIRGLSAANFNYKIGEFMRHMTLIALAFLVCSVAWSGAEFANRAPGFSKVCGPDLDKFCPDIPWMSSFLHVCLEQHKLELSAECAALWIEGSSEAERSFYEYRPNPEKHSSALWTPKNATKVQFFCRGTGDHLTYELKTPYPADVLVKEIDHWLAANKWTITEEPGKAEWQMITDPDGRIGYLWERQRKDSRGQGVHVALAYWGTPVREPSQRLRASIVITPVRPNPFYKEGAPSQATTKDDNTRSADQPHELDKEVTLRSHHEKWLDDAEALIQHQQDIDRYHLKGCSHFKTHEALALRHLATLKEYRSAIVRERQWLRENPATYNGTILDDVRQLKRIEHIRSVSKNIMKDDAQIIDEQQAMLAEDAVTEGLTTTSVNETDLLTAAFEGRADATKLLLRGPVNINAKDKDGFTALMMATDQNHVDIAQVLLQKGADVNVRDNSGNTALSLATDRGYSDIAGLLIAGGADVNLANHQGSAPLMVAAFKGHLDVAQLLIKKRALVNAKNNFGITALMAASEEGHANVVGLLLDSGADVTAKDKDGKTALDNAENENHQDIVAMLQKAAR